MNSWQGFIIGAAGMFALSLIVITIAASFARIWDVASTLFQENRHGR